METEPEAGTSPVDCVLRRTLPIGAVGQQDFIESGLGEGRTFVIVPIKATVEVYLLDLEV